LTGNDDGNPIFQNVPLLKRVYQPAYHLMYVCHQATQLFPIGEFHVLFGKVELQLNQRSEVHEILATLPELIGKSTTHLLHGNLMGGGRIRGDEVSNSFSLG